MMIDGAKILRIFGTACYIIVIFFKIDIKNMWWDFDLIIFSYIFVIERGSKMIRYEKKDISEIFGERQVIDGSYSWNIKS